MSNRIVAADAVGFAYGRKTALEDFDLTLGAGTIALLLGLNGAGKSTALGLLCGRLKAREGRLRIQGGDPRRARTRRHLWMLEEVPAPAPHLSAIESVRFHLDLYGRPRMPRNALDAILERVGLAEVASKRARTFSKGMRRRLELGCLLAVDPQVWLLDEPQSGLDPRGLRLLKDVCRDARDRGRAIVMASHALSDVPELADQVVILRRGKTAFTGTRTELLAKVGARGYVIGDGGDGFDEALVELAREHGVSMEGPNVPAAPLEALLFREEEEDARP